MSLSRGIQGYVEFGEGNIHGCVEWFQGRRRLLNSFSFFFQYLCEALCFQDGVSQLQNTLPHTRTPGAKGLRSFSSTACSLFARVLLDGKTRVIGGSIFRGLKSLGFTPRQKHGLCDRSIGQHGLLTEIECRARALKQVTDSLLDVNRGPSAFAGCWSNANGALDSD